MADTDFTLTKDYLHQIFEYKDGSLFFKQKMGSRGCIGGKVGCINSAGYIITKIQKNKYLVHRLIYLMFYGELPHQIDHINGNRSDNRIENLRKSTDSQNQHNAKIRKDNKSGVKCVYWQKSTNKWAVSISVNKKRLNLGCFEDLELAELVAQEARDKYHGKFARHN